MGEQCMRGVSALFFLIYERDINCHVQFKVSCPYVEFIPGGKEE